MLNNHNELIFTIITITKSTSGLVGVLSRSVAGQRYSAAGESWEKMSACARLYRDDQGSISFLHRTDGSTSGR